MLIPEKSYRHVFLVQNRDYWDSCPYQYDQKLDLVLSYDFGVVMEVSSRGGNVSYIDHIVESDLMEYYNHETYRFFKKWHCNSEDKDLFYYNDIEFGKSLRIEIWNDITYLVRIFLNLLKLKKLDFKKIYAGIEDKSTLDLLEFLDIKIEAWGIEGTPGYQEYYFPVFRWMNEKIHPSGLKPLIKLIFSKIIDSLFRIADTLNNSSREKINIFIQPYYPTDNIIEQLKRDRRFRVVLEAYNLKKSIVKERRLPTKKMWIAKRYRRLAEDIICEFKKQKVTEWKIEGLNIDEALYKVIFRRISSSLPQYLQTIDCIHKFFSKRKLRLMITTTNIGMTNCLLQDYCRKRNIPS